MQRLSTRILLSLAIGAGLGSLVWLANAALANSSYLPIIAAALPTPTPSPTPTLPPTPTPDPNLLVEVRALWVTRFDWTNGTTPAQSSKIDEIVNNAALAGFNVIYFQVRGSADAYYTPGLEPWARRVSGVYGQPPSPLWDPLAYFIQQAHAQGIQLHAYLNAYPVWEPCDSLPDPTIIPRPLYYQLQDQYGVTLLDDGQGNLVTMNNGLQWLAGSTEQCLSSYYRASPASIFDDDHLVAVANDLAARYDLDGIHLDHIRYAGPATSCDPVSLCRYNGLGETCTPTPACNLTGDYQAWQRQQVTGTVRRVYQDVITPHPQLWLSAAVWPIYINQWGWAASQGYYDYYQDSKDWLAQGIIDSISPMIYNSPPQGSDCPEDSTFWTRSVWETLVADFQADNSGRFVIPGIGGAYCNFDEIAWRIQRARELGVAGQAIFSYSGLAGRGFFDDLAAGPYAQPASAPALPWRP